MPQPNRLLENLIDAFKQFPGVGEKTAQRFASYVARAESNSAKKLMQAIADVRSKVKTCEKCFSISDRTPCEICEDENRDTSVICVVESSSDINALEKLGSYKGLYHVLDGAVSAMDGRNLESLKIKELLTRLKKGSVQEVILATNHNVEGEATSKLIVQQVRSIQALSSVRLTRLAMGLPLGGSLMHADKGTLSGALLGRTAADKY